MLLFKVVLLLSLFAAAKAANAFLDDCNISLYGCCSDGKTEAMGRRMEGCGVALCIDVIPEADCRMEKNKGSCDKGRYGDTDWGTSSRMTRDCAKTCRRCKHAAPRMCDSSEFGCCWDGSTAMGPEKRPGIDCPRCHDWKEGGMVCQNLKEMCSTNRGPRSRKFLRERCQKTCGICV